MIHEAEPHEKGAMNQTIFKKKMIKQGGCGL